MSREVRIINGVAWKQYMPSSFGDGLRTCVVCHRVVALSVAIEEGWFYDGGPGQSCWRMCPPCIDLATPDAIIQEPYVPQWSGPWPPRKGENDTGPLPSS